ncbi:MAG: DUF29 domain-containing protein [Chroococcidiopsidaceae cyanobacterium CP_BM_ER_R8_30]|nr:DUF29 domain-containing protein [Chroococcidiopsidaceae cyanobacterium CP_BM_ER_R8_30]
MKNKHESLDLYDRDFYQWTEQQAQHLRDREFSKLDITNLVEEVESLGRSEKNALSSNLRVLLLHLLKYKYQPEKRTGSWSSTIREHRERIIEAIETSPSLKLYFEPIFDRAYTVARRSAADETGLSISKFPASSPFLPIDVIDEDFWP